MTAPGCPAPDSCPVPDPAEADLRYLRTATLPEGTPFHTVYRRRHWPSVFNDSGGGNTRFSPLVLEGTVTPTVYGASTRTAALLETAFHEVHTFGLRAISEQVDLAPRGLVTLRCPSRLTLIDLRNDALERLGVSRGGLVASSAAHYACTREWAADLHGRRVGRAPTVGLLWRSRVAELARGDSPLLRDLLTRGQDEVFVLFGEGDVPLDVDAYHPRERYGDLSAPEARSLIEAIADQLEAVIVPSS